MSFEQLDHRVLLVAGATAIPAVVAPGTDLDGVVYLTNSEGACTGTLLSTGRHILTAAHCVTSDNGTINSPSTNVNFELPGRTLAGNKPIVINVPNSNYKVHPNWNGDSNSSSDIAILTLPQLAPSGPKGVGAARFEINRATNEVGRVVTFAGYGRTGTGGTGSNVDGGAKRFGQNQIDALGQTVLGPVNTLAYDFDNDRRENDAFGEHFGIRHTGIFGEAMGCQGDSGGPLFIGAGEIAGVYALMQSYGDDEDVLDGTNCSSGEGAFYTRVSTFAGWIDSTVGGAYDLVLDLNNQLVGNDKKLDEIELTITFQPVTKLAMLNVIVNGQVYHSDLLNRISNLEIRGSSDQDNVYVPAELGKRVRVDGQGGEDLLVLRNTTAASTSDIAHDAATVRTGALNTILYYTNLQRLNFIGDAGDTVRVNGGKFETPISVTNAGLVTVNTTGVASQVDIIGNATKLTIDNSNSTAHSEFRVHANSVTALPGHSSRSIDFDDGLVSLTINGGANGALFHVDNTPLAPTTFNTGLGADRAFIGRTQSPLTINGQAGQDAVTLSSYGDAQGIRGAVTVTNSKGYTNLTIDDSAAAVARNVTVSTVGIYTQVVGLTPATVRAKFMSLSALNLLLGAGNDSIIVNGTYSPLDVNLGGGTNTSTVGSNAGGLGQVQGAVKFHGATKQNALVVNDAAATVSHGYLVGAEFVQRADLPRIDFRDMKSLRVIGGAVADQFTIQSTPTVAAMPGAMTLESGGGDDGFHVKKTVGPLNIRAGGSSFVEVGDTFSSLDGIQGKITVDGAAYGVNNTRLALNDRATTIPRQLDITARPDGPGGLFAPSGAVPISGNVSTFAWNGGSGGNTINLLDRLPIANSFTLGAGDDRLNLGTFEGRASGLGAMSVDGGTGVDIVNFNDAGEDVPQDYAVYTYLGRQRLAATGTTMSLLGGVEALNLHGGGGGNNVRISGTGPGVSTNVYAGAGDDSINVGTHLNRLAGDLVYIAAGDGQDTMIVDDSANVDGRNFSIIDAMISSSNANLIFHEEVESLAILGGAGPDGFGYQGVSPAAFAIDGGGGENALGGDNAPNTFRIKGLNQGVANDWLAFNAIQSFNGGDDDDMFVFAPGAAVDGRIDGFLGVNTLDYGDYGTDVTVDLALGVATGVSGGIANIQHVIGGAGNDFVVGAGGNDVGGGRRDRLMAGATSSRLSGGVDILFGGTTASDDDQATLGKVKDEWLRDELDLDTRTDNQRGGRLAVGNVSSHRGSQTRLGRDVRDLLFGSMLDWTAVDAVDVLVEV